MSDFKIMAKRGRVALVAGVLAIQPIAVQPAEASYRCLPYGYHWAEWLSPAWLAIHWAANQASGCQS